MAATKVHGLRFAVTFNPAVDMEGFLDMLRYDAAVVHNWDHIPGAGGYQGRYCVTLDAKSPTVERWASFGLRIEIKSSF
jgi:hypothetical protein